MKKGAKKQVAVKRKAVKLAQKKFARKHMPVFTKTILRYQFGDHLMPFQFPNTSSPRSVVQGVHRVSFVNVDMNNIDLGQIGLDIDNFNVPADAYTMPYDDDTQSSFSGSSTTDTGPVVDTDTYLMFSTESLFS